MASVLIRELKRKLPNEALARHAESLRFFQRVHAQKRTDANKIYSLREPDVLCIGKGKEREHGGVTLDAPLERFRLYGMKVGTDGLETNGQ